jgi:hypothetical protein
MKRGDLKPAHARWSSEEESVRVTLLRPLVWTAGFLETSLGKHLEQLRRDRLVEHILSAAGQRFVEIDMRQGQMVAGPASCGHLAVLRSTRQFLSRAMSSNARRGIVLPPDGSPETDPGREEAERELEAYHPRRWSSFLIIRSCSSSTLAASSRAILN